MAVQGDISNGDIGVGNGDRAGIRKAVGRGGGNGGVPGFECGKVAFLVDRDNAGVGRSPGNGLVGGVVGGDGGDQGIGAAGKHVELMAVQGDISNGDIHDGDFAAGYLYRRREFFIGLVAVYFHFGRNRGSLGPVFDLKSCGKKMPERIRDFIRRHKCESNEAGIGAVKQDNIFPLRFQAGVQLHINTGNLRAVKRELYGKPYSRR